MCVSVCVCVRLRSVASLRKTQVVVGGGACAENSVFIVTLAARLVDQQLHCDSGLSATKLPHQLLDPLSLKVFSLHSKEQCLHLPVLWTAPQAGSFDSWTRAEVRFAGTPSSLHADWLCWEWKLLLIAACLPVAGECSPWWATRLRSAVRSSTGTARSSPLAPWTRPASCGTLAQVCV